MENENNFPDLMIFWHVFS